MYRLIISKRQQAKEKKKISVFVDAYIYMYMCVYMYLRRVKKMKVRFSKINEDWKGWIYRKKKVINQSIDEKEREREREA